MALWGFNQQGWSEMQMVDGRGKEDPADDERREENRKGAKPDYRLPSSGFRT